MPQTAKDLMTTEVLSAYEGWAIQRLDHFLKRHELARVPVIASDHQLVGSVGSADIHRLMQLDETYRAQMINDNFRRATGQDVENLDELTQWTRRAHVYCTVHQIMQRETEHLEDSTPLKQVREWFKTHSLSTLWLTNDGILSGQIHAHQLL
ncbi:CBS domain-containing protein [Gilvimarinus xylanilyticus]|uniref:CBS domain-containing protein n=1 Tax=Gilvimarinus xylanilyticus TaxID=2944139 RepID=A0A9X2I2E1_9GAMM|nr:CBS domain-containing protein [Gilvimarinus xylanilyticus]MCP8897677.1 CBS domain-containing protein [Gilvimarinus xylanilyticus]